MFILFVPLLMCVGAACWLVVARRVIPRPIARAFFVYPGLGILSLVGEWIFVRAYRKDGR